MRLCNRNTMIIGWEWWYYGFTSTLFLSILRIYLVFILWAFENRFPFAILLWNTYSTSYVYSTYMYSTHYHPSLSNQNCIGWKHAYSSKYFGGFTLRVKRRVINPLHDITTHCYSYEFKTIANCLMEFRTVFFYLKKKSALCTHYTLCTYIIHQNIYIYVWMFVWYVYVYVHTYA